jgi:CheY-like chemotaxis protein
MGGDFCFRPQSRPGERQICSQQFRREVRQGFYVLHFASSGEEALEMLTEGIRPELIVILSASTCPAWTA